MLFTSLMCQLRGMSFCLDSCLSARKKEGEAKKDKVDDKDQIKYGFIDLLGYNLYLPLFCNGPVVLYNEFYKQVQWVFFLMIKKLLCKSNELTLLHLTIDVTVCTHLRTYFYCQKLFAAQPIWSSEGTKQKVL